MRSSYRPTWLQETFLELISILDYLTAVLILTPQNLSALHNGRQKTIVSAGNRFKRDLVLASTTRIYDATHELWVFCGQVC